MQAFENYLKRHTPLTGEQISVLKQELKEKTYQKGKILLREGESTGLGYFVCSGLLRAYTLDSQGKEHTIQFAPEDWWLGDRNSFYFHEPAAFNIDVLEETQVVIVTKNFMEHATEICPEFGKYHIYLLHNSIRYMQRRINQLLAATAEERYLDFIRLYPKLTLRISQIMIASYLGITPESLSRVRKELARRNSRV
ncbi:MULTISPECIES: Crp/Fnr family transcriptional regulator [Olivibacter]|jgi:CRP-like cAMP-binding protein|uniref:Crp/Fnr family transcriptional regulator n=4 Tax=Sphingobacteriaceae TaxID=84566 RepID=A0ABV6HSA2_9SPHI|nr:MULTISPECIES: Crp/Fnr family transcriptional regulator [Olivibacter]MCL4639627.1 Crp/Fnr family transcriptional regulator [Olivibacter sp. UJ_SKK_5.1]MDX3916584.1 Crp/Fnr family transcriptional regulator [Pseudosphingobacterium sp.]QEL01207.1 Crp/Fnr family transcriptional regulator [Olivibacter sp. LS-1]